MLPGLVEEYLKKFALKDWSLGFPHPEKITAAVVVPAISEYESILRLLASLCENKNEYFASTLFIFVINNPPSSSHEIKEENKKSIRLIHSVINKEKSSGDDLVTRIISAGLQIALVDASTSGNEFPEKDAGAGLARKVGLDLALTIFDYNSSGKKILVNLDADCLVDKNYLSEIIGSFNNRNLHAAVINYAHEICGKESEAIICYEIFLRYYELGLMLAGSPFAFHSIGSTIACDYETYIKAGGMSKRKAGEDFYFLEKLAKITSIEWINGTTVRPSPRGSWRVPFGTGQRVYRFMANAENEYLLYDPKSFLILKRWLEVFLCSDYFKTKSLMDTAGSVDKRLKNFLVSQNFESDWEKILLNSKTSDQISRQKINWFDGFKTMKLIHYLRDNGMPMINMFDALDTFLPMLGDAVTPEAGIISKERKNQPVPSIEIQMKYLNLLRNLSANLCEVSRI